MQSMRFLSWPPGILAVIAAFGLSGCTRPAPAPEPVRAVRTLTVTAATVTGQREYAAEVRARTESRLGFRVAGKLLRRQADVGQSVRAGQVLAELDPQDLSLAQDAARAALASAQATATQAQADLARFHGLHAQGFISDAELERRATAARAAQAQVAQTAAQSAVQRNQVAYSRLLAPSAGVVTAVEAEPGAVLAAGAAVLRLAHAGPRDAVFAVPEDAVDGLRARIGHDAALSVRLWGRSESRPATVREVAAAADPTTRTFQVKADLGAARADLGQTASVTLTLPPTTGALRLPVSALHQLGDRTAVWLLDGKSMTVRAQVVEVVGADGNLALLAGGIAPGDEVVTAGVHVLSEGQAVTRYADTARPAAPR